MTAKSLSIRKKVTLEETVQQYIQIPNCHHKSTQAVEEFNRPSPQQWPPPQQWQQQPSLSESLDDALQRFLKNSDSIQKSIEASCKKMEMHLRYISQKLNVKVNTEVNPKEEGQASVTESEKIFAEKKIRGDEEKIERKEKEELSEKDKDEEKEKEELSEKDKDEEKEKEVDKPKGVFQNSADLPVKGKLPPSGTLTDLWFLLSCVLDSCTGGAEGYDPDSINNFLDTVWAGEQCQFALCMEEGADFDDVERVLCVPRGHFQRNRTGSVVNIRRTDLTPLAKYWMAFSHANIQPCSHVSNITLSRALLLYFAIKNLNVNIGQVIADEIRMCANTTNSKAPLGHPSLITHLCKIAGVDTSAPPFERPRKAIDEAYYRQYCGGEEEAQPVPPRRTRRERGQAQSQAFAETHEAEPFQMRDMYMSLIGAQLQSIHKGQVATTEMIVGMYDTPPAHRWTMEEFHNVVAWPEEQVQGGRAEVAEASAMEVEEDDVDDDEDDAFEDVEDEEEEEDTDDSSD
ncbi:hypothetical protein LR48_Vigan263s000300 [Vigna angularis]|uniref:Putative plant transposon protein domain-containing protein n=1 Tax=Phaseolus angularis TaxID=3914 RepID=A0A0L9T705_PHAAN|nr:hypothetical protein LR48_Vigan263s000300 [Vigna angularis]